MLSIATAPVSGRERFVAIAVIVVLVAVSIGAFPFVGLPEPTAPGLMPAALAIAFLGYAITGYLLLSQFQSSRLVGTAILGCAYLTTGLTLFAYVLCFPGLFPLPVAAPVGYWLWALWHAEFALLVLGALIADRAKWSVPDRATAARWTAPLLIGVLVVFGLSVGAIVAAALALGPYSKDFGVVERTSIGEAIVVTTLVVLALAIVWTRGRTVLQSWLIVALTAAALDAQITVAGSYRYTLGWYLARLLIICSAAAVLSAYLRQIHVLFAKLSDLSMVDGLTGLPNRRFFEERLDVAIRAASRTRRPLALLLADVDGFKQFNDTYGHLAGDETLKAVAATLRGTALRPGDVVARWGGDEFVAVLPETDLEGAYLVAERLRLAVAALLIAHRRAPTPAGVVTVCVGVALLDERDARMATLLARADAALYRVKQDGRNAVAVELDANGTAIDAMLGP